MAADPGAAPVGPRLARERADHPLARHAQQDAAAKAMKQAHPADQRKVLAQRLAETMPGSTRMRARATPRRLGLRHRGGEPVEHVEQDIVIGPRARAPASSRACRWNASR